MKIYIILFGFLFTMINSSPTWSAPLKITNEERGTAQVYVPKQYTVEKKWPVVLLLHGYKFNGALQEAYLGLRLYLSQKGFILMVLDGTKNKKGQRFWNATDYCCDFDGSGVDDVQFVRQALQRLSEQYSVDSKRVSVIGHSNGGFMANRLACDAGELFTSMAVIAGAAYKDPEKCAGKKPISLLHIHALNDEDIPYEGGNNLPSVQETLVQWRERSGCSETPIIGKELNLIFNVPGNDITPMSWDNCNEGTAVELWTIRNYSAPLYSPHIPLPGPGFTSRILDFLLTH